MWTNITVMTVEHTQFGSAWISGPGGPYYWVKVNTATLSLEIIVSIPTATYTYFRTQTQTHLTAYTTAYVVIEPFTTGAIAATVLVAVAIGAILLLKKMKSKHPNVTT